MFAVLSGISRDILPSGGQFPPPFLSCIWEYSQQTSGAVRAQGLSPICPFSIPLTLNPHRLCAPRLGSQSTLQKYTPTWELPVFSRDSAWQGSNPSFHKVSLQLGNLLPTKDLQLLLSACLYFLSARFTSMCQHAQLSKDHFNLCSYLNNLNTECSERWWGSRELTFLIL